MDECGCCNNPFDASDATPDGSARYAESPWCRGCVDRCYEATDAFHECVICRSTEGIR